jgi:hypothetical protein
LTARHIKPEADIQRLYSACLCKRHEKNSERAQTKFKEMMAKEIKAVEEYVEVSYPD